MVSICYASRLLMAIDALGNNGILFIPITRAQNREK